MLFTRLTARTAVRNLRSAPGAAILRSNAPSSFAALRSFSGVPSKIPSGIELMQGFPPDTINLSEHIAGKSVIIVGLPGAFTPTWSEQQVPGYLEKQEALKEAGIDEVLVYCVNDPAVMQAWATDQKVGGSMINFMADPAADLTKALDMEMTHPGPPSVGIIGRCKRFAIHAVDGTIQTVKVSEGPDDPAGDSDPSATLVDGFLAAIKEK
jgi:2-Cys peroxiredoxin 5